MANESRKNRCVHWADDLELVTIKEIPHRSELPENQFDFKLPAMKLGKRKSSDDDMDDIIKECKRAKNITYDMDDLVAAFQIYPALFSYSYFILHGRGYKIEVKKSVGYHASVPLPQLSGTKQ
ncbi:hypothetical protein CHUAL_007237 [Chamberlinius hualienensis]